MRATDSKAHWNSRRRLTQDADFPMSVIFFSRSVVFFPDKTGDRYLVGNGQYVISAQRSIRIFGKRFMESGITSILVQGGPEQEKSLNSSKIRKTLEIYYCQYWISC